MDNTIREIQNGCRSHSKSIYIRRNQLLAIELSDLLNGRQGVLSFLDHSSDVLFIRNMREFDMFLTMKENEPIDTFDLIWAGTNQERVVRSASSLYHKLCPNQPRHLYEILRDVKDWSFQQDIYEYETRLDQEDCFLSLLRPRAHDSFIAIRNQFRRDESTLSSEIGLASFADGQRDHTQRVFEGQSYRLEIKW